MLISLGWESSLKFAYLLLSWEHNSVPTSVGLYIPPGRHSAQKYRCEHRKSVWPTAMAQAFGAAICTSSHLSCNPPKYNSVKQTNLLSMAFLWPS